MKRSYLNSIVISLMISSSLVSFSINSVSAYASENKSISVTTSSGNSISLYSDQSCKSKYEVDSNDIESGETYYVNTSASKIRIHTSEDSDKVRIIKGNKLYEETDTIPLSKDSSTTLYVRVYDNDVSSNTDKNTSYSYQYKIKVNNLGNTSENLDEADVYDDVCLNNISVMDDNDEDLGVNFYSYISSYDVNVDDDTDYVYVKADLKNDDDTVKINSVTVNSDDSYERKVYLSQGLNTISIKVQDEDGNIKVYTIKVTKGENITSSNNAVSTSSQNSTTLISGLKDLNEVTSQRNVWIKNNDGKWQYRDSEGRLMKNKWYFDNTFNNYYYFDAEGNMKTGWALYNGHYYYLDNSGAMKTGWFQDSDGKWYFLNDDGIMQSNTVIGGYKLGINGALV